MFFATTFYLQRQPLSDFSCCAIIAIQSNPKWRSHQKDRWIWLKTTSGYFSIKSAFKEVCQEDRDIEVNVVLKRIWQTNFHQRLKMLFWRIAAGVLPTKVSLLRFLPNLESFCPFCNWSNELVIHIFWECSLARAIWFGSTDVYVMIFYSHNVLLT